MAVKRTKPNEWDLRQLASAVKSFWKNLYGPDFRQCSHYQQDREALWRVRRFVRERLRSEDDGKALALAFVTYTECSCDAIYGCQHFERMAELSERILANE